jgi:hypothetical protein
VLALLLVRCLAEGLGRFLLEQTAHSRAEHDPSWQLLSQLESHLARDATVLTRAEGRREGDVQVGVLLDERLEDLQVV